MEKFLDTILKQINEMIDLKDGPTDDTLDFITKFDLGSIPIPGLKLDQSSPREMLEGFLKMTGGDLELLPPDIDFEEIESGIRLRFKSPEAREEFKVQMEGLFNLEQIKKLLEPVLSMFGGLFGGNGGGLFSTTPDDESDDNDENVVGEDETE